MRLLAPPHMQLPRTRATSCLQPVLQLVKTLRCRVRSGVRETPRCGGARRQYSVEPLQRRIASRPRTQHAQAEHKCPAVADGRRRQTHRHPRANRAGRMRRVRRQTARRAQGQAALARQALARVGPVQGTDSARSWRNCRVQQRIGMLARGTASRPPTPARGCCATCRGWTDGFAEVELVDRR